MFARTLPAMLFSLVALGAAAQTPAAVATPADPERRPYAKPGILAALPDGRRIHFNCMGSGSPTVIMTAGLGDWSASWRKVQPTVARSTRVCTWDRAGFGFSDGSTQVQLIANTVSDLEAALKSAAIAGPYLMVGHSMGGLESVLFADRHPEAVAGMVLVDPSVPDQADRLGKAAPSMAAAVKGLRAPILAEMRDCASGVQSGAIGVGTPDPKGCLVYTGGYPPETAAALAQRDTEWLRWAAKISLHERFDESARSLARPARNYGAMPLIVLTAGKPFTPPASMAPATAEAIRAGWPAFSAEFNRAHDDLAALSTRGSNRMVADAGHYIQYDRPDLVIAAIEEVVKASRDGARAMR